MKVVFFVGAVGRVDSCFLVVVLVVVVFVEGALVLLVLGHATLRAESVNLVSMLSTGVTSLSCSSKTYRMGSIFSAVEMDHAINAGESSTSTAASVGIELLLGQDVATGLLRRRAQTRVG